MIAAKAVMDSLLEHAADVESLAVLSRFRVDFRARPAGTPGGDCKDATDRRDPR